MTRRAGLLKDPAGRRRRPAWPAVRAQLDAALASLPEREISALILRHARCLSPGQVAAELKTSRARARRLLDRSLGRLRGRLAAVGLGLSLERLAGYLARLAAPAPDRLTATIIARCRPAPANWRLTTLAAQLAREDLPRP